MCFYIRTVTRQSNDLINNDVLLFWTIINTIARINTGRYNVEFHKENENLLFLTISHFKSNENTYWADANKY